MQYTTAQRYETQLNTKLTDAINSMEEQARATKPIHEPETKEICISQGKRQKIIYEHRVV